MPNTYADLRRRNKAAGHHWFSPATLRFFRTHLEGSPYGGDVFVTSEQFVGSDGTADPRRYTVRRMLEDGTVETVGDFQQHDTLDDARRAARLAAHDLLHPTPAP